MVQAALAAVQHRLLQYVSTGACGTGWFSCCAAPLNLFMFPQGPVAQACSAAVQHHLTFFFIFSTGACGTGLLSCCAASLAKQTHMFKLGPVVQAVPAALQHHWIVFVFSTGACCTGLFSCCAAPLNLFYIFDRGLWHRLAQLLCSTTRQTQYMFK